MFIYKPIGAKTDYLEYLLNLAAGEGIQGNHSIFVKKDLNFNAIHQLPRIADLGLQLKILKQTMQIDEYDEVIIQVNEQGKGCPRNLRTLEGYLTNYVKDETIHYNPLFFNIDELPDIGDHNVYAKESVIGKLMSFATKALYDSQVVPDKEKGQLIEFETSTIEGILDRELRANPFRFLIIRNYGKMSQRDKFQTIIPFRDLWEQEEGYFIAEENKKANSADIKWEKGQDKYRKCESCGGLGEISGSICYECAGMKRVRETINIHDDKIPNSVLKERSKQVRDIKGNNIKIRTIIQTIHRDIKEIHILKEPIKSRKDFKVNDLFLVDSISRLTASDTIELTLVKIIKVCQEKQKTVIRRQANVARFRCPMATYIRWFTHEEGIYQIQGR